MSPGSSRRLSTSRELPVHRRRGDRFDAPRSRRRNYTPMVCFGELKVANTVLEGLRRLIRHPIMHVSLLLGTLHDDRISRGENRAKY